MSRTKSSVLWCAIHHNGRFIGIKGLRDQRYVLCLFSSPSLCEEWLSGMGIEEANVSPPLYPRRIANALKVAKNGGWDLATLNPPSGMRGAFEATQIENLIAQAEEQF